MKCKFCGRELPDVKTGKRQREYCNDAHKQAAFRRRHGSNPNPAETRRQLVEAKLRIMELERLVRDSGLTVPVKRQQDIQPVTLAHFAGLHGIAQTDAERLVTMKMITLDNNGRIEAHGQYVFWKAYKNTTYSWHDCPDCPHEE